MYLLIWHLDAYDRMHLGRPYPIWQTLAGIPSCCTFLMSAFVGYFREINRHGSTLVVDGCGVVQFDIAPLHTVQHMGSTSQTGMTLTIKGVGDGIHRPE